MGRDKARIWLAGIRIFNGAGGLLAPKWLAKRVSPEPEPNPAADPPVRDLEKRVEGLPQEGQGMLHHHGGVLGLGESQQSFPVDGAVAHDHQGVGHPAHG